jgi:hypothetical protein
VQRSIAAFFAFAVFVLIPSSLFAQSKTEIYLGDSFMVPPISVHEQVSYCPIEGSCSVPGTIYTNREGINGWELSGLYHFAPSLSFVGDATGNYGIATSGFQRNARVRQHTFLGGVQYERKGHFTPFLHALVGATYQQTTASGNSFFVTFPNDEWGLAGVAGGGIDVKVTDNFSFRLIEADYMVTHLGGSMQSQPRFSAGFMLRL